MIIIPIVEGYFQNCLLYILENSVYTYFTTKKNLTHKNLHPPPQIMGFVSETLN